MIQDIAGHKKVVPMYFSYIESIWPVPIIEPSEASMSKGPGGMAAVDERFNRKVQLLTGWKKLPCDGGIKLLKEYQFLSWKKTAKETEKLEL